MMVLIMEGGIVPGHYHDNHIVEIADNDGHIVPGHYHDDHIVEIADDVGDIVIYGRSLCHPLPV